MDNLVQEYARAVQELAAQPGVWALSVDEDVLEESMFLPGDVDHPNAAGHRVIATELFRFLITEGPISGLNDNL